MQTDTHCNLFVYGSLQDKSLLQSVCGYDFDFTLSKAEKNTLPAEPGFVLGYATVSPDKRYHYAVPSSDNRIEGFIIHKMPKTSFVLIDRYEGRYYTREEVVVHTSRTRLKSQAYLANELLLFKSFGDWFDTLRYYECLI